MAPFLRNQWYTAATSVELGEHQERRCVLKLAMPSRVQCSSEPGRTTVSGESAAGIPTSEPR
jgi:hypothetical protein